MGWSWQANFLCLYRIRLEPSCSVQCVQPSVPHSLVDVPTEWPPVTHRETVATQYCITLHVFPILSSLTAFLSLCPGI